MLTQLLDRLLSPDPEKWQMIREALKTWGSTVRLCLIILVGALRRALIAALTVAAIIMAEHIH